MKLESQLFVKFELGGKMNKGIIICFAIFGIIFITGCGGGDDDSGNSQSNIEKKDISSYEYLPLAIGNKWVYEIHDDNSSDGDVYNIYVFEILSEQNNSLNGIIIKGDTNGNVTNSKEVILSVDDNNNLLLDNNILIPQSLKEYKYSSTTSLFYRANTSIFSASALYYMDDEDSLSLMFNDYGYTAMHYATINISEKYKKNIGLFELNKESYSQTTSGILVAYGSEMQGKLIYCIINDERYDFPENAIIPNDWTEPIVNSSGVRCAFEENSQFKKIELN